MKVTLLSLLVTLVSFASFGQGPCGPGGEMDLVKKELTDFTMTKNEKEAVYSVRAEQLNLKCEGNQRVKIRLGETADVKRIKVDGKVREAKGKAPFVFDVTELVMEENRFPPMVKDFDLEVAIGLPKAGEPASAPKGPVEVVVVFKIETGE